jgi:hypothetical protein
MSVSNKSASEKVLDSSAEVELVFGPASAKGKVKNMPTWITAILLLGVLVAIPMILVLYLLINGK